MNPYAPFNSQVDWEVAQWAKLCGPTSTTFSNLLSINRAHEKLGLSYKNSRELNKIIDKQLPGRPKFRCEQIVVSGKAFDIFYRDVIECVKALYGDLDFADFLVFAPECHYADKEKTVQLFHDMHTGKWWWDNQKKLDQRKLGATIIPIIISSDKTQVTKFQNKTAYPPSRRAHILLAYLPTTCLEHITNKASQCRTIANLPLFSCFIGHYPEQVLATGVKAMECPKCDIPPDKLGRNATPFKMRNLNVVLDALAAIDHGDIKFVHACHKNGIKPIIHLFWEPLPYTNIFQAITPDVPHQLYQGLIKHLLGWLAKAFGAAEIDARCQRLHPNHHIHLFMKGITSLSRISGTEHSQICHFLLGIIVDIRLPNQLALSCQSSETLTLLVEALDLFHDNKQIFLHAAQHYMSMIQTFGMTDNYNTEYTERLHIDLAKDVYCTTNHKDEFIVRHERYHPSVKSVPIQKLVTEYGAMYFCEALVRYVAQLHHPHEATTHFCLEDLAATIHLPFRTLPVYHIVKCDLCVMVDSVHIKPHHVATSLTGTDVPARFDTVLINDGTGHSVGIEGQLVKDAKTVLIVTNYKMLNENTYQPQHVCRVLGSGNVGKSRTSRGPLELTTGGSASYKWRTPMRRLHAGGRWDTCV
ncbi:uncharacterized protein F5891DRAFT_1130506 [Suillus fuscotomentosus]|uniref:Uncharacterized protein n=1 Tax=Suillus fuscotomentosus TaxID=1912939 RepID=A0AAD4DXZ5_9AGAM|nr:uncharacterized protein F5891DRAFT_1130506 [Suillus fuscotomentosus]KAG1895712.1 hypothetical protein F5891DRAFT_1130506 [Suillus fuscotomentosus]